MTEFLPIGSRKKLNTVTASPTLPVNGSAINQATKNKSLIDKFLKKGPLLSRPDYLSPTTLHLIDKGFI